MKFFDVGPEPIQVRGYGTKRKKPLSPGGVKKIARAKAFYNLTRRWYSPWAYSFFCVVAPVAVLASAFLLIRDHFPESLILGSSAVSIERFCASPFSRSPLANVITASALQFAVTHVVLLTACGLAFVFATWTARNVLAIHVLPVSLRPRWAALAVDVVMPIAVAVVTLVLGHAAFYAAEGYLGDNVRALFGSDAAFAHWHANKTNMDCLTDALSVAGTLDAQAHRGVLAVALTGVALALAAATIAFRFETKDIDGPWADTYVLRHKLKALLTLFLLASVVLVVTNIALASYTDFAANVFGEIEASGTACFYPTPNTQPELFTPDCTKTAATPATSSAGANDGNKPDAAQSAGEPPKPPGAVAELFAKAESLRKTLLNFAGGLASLTLVAMFLPAFAGLTSDIEIAGKTHASADLHPTDSSAEKDAKKQGRRPALRQKLFGLFVSHKHEETAGAELDVSDVIMFVSANAEPASANETTDPKPNLVAGWKTVEDWKNTHGLSLEFSDVVTTLAAAAAPVLSNGAFDLSKSLLGVH